MVFVKAQTGPANVGDPKGRFTVQYIDEIVKITKLDPERTIKSLSTAEFLIFWKAIEQIEN